MNVTEGVDDIDIHKGRQHEPALSEVQRDQYKY